MPCTVNNNTSHDLSQLEDLTKKLVPFAQKQIGFNRPPTINFNDDEKNAANPLGRTAQYDPSNMEIIVFVTGRHTKDILRSIAHELVHHGQNCRGDLSGDIQTELGYAQNNEHMRGMEREAYEVGNLCFRDWEDGIKQQLPLYETIYRESLIGGETMTMKTWRIKELNDLLMEKWGYKPPAKKKLDEDLDAYMDMVDYQTGEERLDEDDDDDSDGDDDDEEESSSDDPPVSPQSPEFRKSTQSEQLNEQWWWPFGGKKKKISTPRPSIPNWKKPGNIRKKWEEVFDNDHIKRYDYPGPEKAARIIDDELSRRALAKELDLAKRKRREKQRRKELPEDFPDELDGAPPEQIKKHKWCRTHPGWCFFLVVGGGTAAIRAGKIAWNKLWPSGGDKAASDNFLKKREPYPFGTDAPPPPPPPPSVEGEGEEVEAIEVVPPEVEPAVPAVAPIERVPTKKTRVRVKKQREAPRPPQTAPDPTVDPVSPKETPKKYGKGVTWDDAGCPPGTWTMLIGRHTKKCGTSLYGDKKGTLPCGAVYKCNSNKHMK